MTSLIRIAQRFATAIDALSEWSGRLTAWLTLAMILLISYDVSMRYLFQSGSTAIQELEWHFFALIFLLGAAYTLKYDEHVRVDILYQSRWMNDSRRAWVNLLGGLLFLLPFCAVIIHSSWPFVVNSFEMNEGSPDAGGLPYRFLLKAAIPLGMAMVALQGIAMMIRSAQTIFCPHHNAAKETEQP